MKKTFFGTDGIRGKVGKEPMTASFALKLGHAVGNVLVQQEHQPVVLIGKDTRLSGYMLESALESGLISAGVSVVLLGPIPTPAVAYLVRAQRASLGVVISASHNPYHDNGVKFFSSNGTKLPDAWELAVEASLAEKPVWVDTRQLGRAKRLDDAAGRYIEFCKSTFDKCLSLKGLKIVVDAAHGAAYHIAPDVFHELGAEVVKIGCAPDGMNINAGVGVTQPQVTQEAVLKTQADFGVALDGDADRVQIVDAKGRLFNGDELLYAMALDRLALGQSIPGVVGTFMTNMAVEQALKKRGIVLERAQVGDRYVLEVLGEKDWILGGESSGHLLVLDKHSTGDGLVGALQVLEYVVRSGCSLATLLQDVTLYPQTIVNVRITPNTHWAEHNAFLQAKAALEAELGEHGRVLVRASGTEPMVRIMVESADAKESKACAERLAATLV